MADTVDAVVLGGGFYGAVIAVYLKEQRKLPRVVLLEKEQVLLSRASHTNQARVHNGYHYPRSFTTAYRSRVNFPRFLADWPSVVKRDFTKLYAIARQGSKVTAQQFSRFCGEIGAALRPVDDATRALFEPRLIEEVFAVDEWAFDAKRLASILTAALERSSVDVLTGARAHSLKRAANNRLNLVIERSSGEYELDASYVFNCTYSGLNQLRGAFGETQTVLKHEITEMGLIDAPPALRDFGITVMDGPFFSMMPFPSRGLHTLSHVRYTPHASWRDSKDVDPYRELAGYHRESRVHRMLLDATRYVPAFRTARHVDSLFEVKTILTKNESDDGRPILFERHPELSGCFSILGGKIDNIYDALERLDAETFSSGKEAQ